MTAQQNINLIHKLFDLFNQNDPKKLNAFDELLAPNCHLHDPIIAHPKAGSETFKQTEKEYIKAFPNKKLVIDDIFSTEDRVAARWTTKGNHKGEFQGIAGTDREFTISGISFYRIANNKIIEIWRIWDRQGLLEQIGKTHMAHASR